MCGILGGNVGGWDYQKAIEVIAHRGPDGQRIEQYKEFTLGFCRLSIRDLSDSAMQPMSNMNKDVHIVFNGEIYGCEDLKETLSQKYIFRTTSDTEVILNAYLEYGESFVDRIDGIFAIAIFDERVNKIFLYRDRVGVKPLYYYLCGKRFGFASELKALEKAINDEKLEVDYTAAYDYLFLQYVPEPKSIYKKIYKLPAATMLVYDVAKSNVESHSEYWQVRVNGSVDRKRSIEEISDDLRRLIAKSVKEQLVADVPVGTFLSGGIDSSIITYEASKAAPLICGYTMGFDEKEFDESAIAERFCAEKNIQLRKKKLNVFNIGDVRQKIRSWYDEPFADTSAYPTFYVSEFAKSEVTVVLTGDGGDELFGGYSRHARFYNASLESKHMSDAWEKLRYEREQIRNGLGIYDTDFYHKYARQWNIPSDYDPYVSLFKYDNPALPPFTRMRYLDFHTYLRDDILTKVDRVSMAVSLEARVPFLSREVVEYAFSLSEGECNHDHILKACLKDAYDGIISNEVLYGQKKGFGTPTNYLWRENKHESVSSGILNVHWNEIAEHNEGDHGASSEQSVYRNYKRMEAKYNILSQWRSFEEDGYKMADVLSARGYQTVALYGMGDIAKHLYRALKDSDVKVKYGIDKNVGGQYDVLTVKKPDEELEPVDAVIVTIVTEVEETVLHLKKRTDSPIVSVEEVLYETDVFRTKNDHDA